jgi:hypothetical protein
MLGQVLYTKVFDTQRASQTFRKLKSILVVSSDVFLKFISNTSLSKYVEIAKLHFPELSESLIFGSRLEQYTVVGSSEDKKNSASSANA